MSRKPSKQEYPEKSDPRYSARKIPSVFKKRDGLGAYLEHPESFPSSTVIYFTDDFVVVHDLYPKSTVHLLLLPRDPEKFTQHPFDALEDPEFLAKAKQETDKLKRIAASELRRRFGRFSRSEKARSEAMESDPAPEPEDLPPGRDWESEIHVGIHAHPSMNHLHIHVISADRYSERMKHRKHYNSFATPFFVPIEDFPLAQDDVRRREGYLKWDLKCWRCGKNFGNKFAQLKGHLEDEFEEWKRE